MCGSTAGPRRAGCDGWAAELQREALAGVDLDTLPLDSTTVKFHPHGTGAPKKRGPRRSAVSAAA